MKIKEGYLLRHIADTYLVVPVGEMVVNFNGMMVLSDVSAKVWEYLGEDRTREQIIDYIIHTYDIDRGTAEGDIDHLIAQMESSGVLAT
jgi:hypothetical protein